MGFQLMLAHGLETHLNEQSTVLNASKSKVQQVLELRLTCLINLTIFKIANLKIREGEMAKVLTPLSRYQRMINFADQSMAELEERIEDFKAELERWRNIRESIQYGLRICPHCHGDGKIRVSDASLGLLLEEEDCPRCAGSGQAGNQAV